MRALTYVTMVSAQGYINIFFKFICGLLNDAVNSSGCVASKDKLTEWNGEETDCGLI